MALVRFDTASSPGALNQSGGRVGGRGVGQNVQKNVVLEGRTSTRYNNNQKRFENLSQKSNINATVWVYTPWINWSRSQERRAGKPSIGQRSR